MKKPLLVLFDGTNLVHRAFHVLPPLTIHATGEVVGAVYGFTSMLIKVVGELKPDCYAIAFDKKGPTFRHHLYSGYKAHRPAMPDELVGQLGRVRQMVEALKIPVFELANYEADDVLGALARQAAEQGLDVVIVSGDGDAMQMVSEGVRVMYPNARGAFGETTLFDEAAVKEKYGVPPERITDLKALVGDTSDAIPGVRGIGEKTAMKLIADYGRLEDIYTRAGEVTPPRLRELLLANEAIARQSKVLATIVTDLPIKLEITECRAANYDRETAVRLFRELEFTSLLPRLDAAMTAQPAPKATLAAEVKYSIVADLAALRKAVRQASASERLALSVIGSSEEAGQAQWLGLALAPAVAEVFYIPASLVMAPAPGQLPLPADDGGLKVLLADPGTMKVIHGAKYAVRVLENAGFTIGGAIFDTMLAAHLLGEKTLELPALVFGRLGAEITAVEGLLAQARKKKAAAGLTGADIGQAACAEADYTGRLYAVFEPELRLQKLDQLFNDVEQPLLPVLLVMEKNGILLDKPLLERMAHRTGAEMALLEKEIYSLSGREFNIGSPSQLGQVLFAELKLPSGKKTKTGFSTEASVLEALRQDYPIVDRLMSYRALQKLKFTYLDTLPQMVDTTTGRLHTSFNQVRTATGRLSSSEPNLQNIPVRGESGKEIRSAFVAPPGSTLLAGDYSQIDLRVLAHLSQDEGLMEAFRLGEDIHAATAVRVFGATEGRVPAELRRLAKTVNFGIIYGMSGYGLEQATELSREEANKFILAYFEKYPSVKAYLEATKQQAREVGYVQTILGRRRYIPEIHSANRILREAAERMAINMPVQGSSADIIKVAMLRLHAEMNRLKLASKMLLQVHDELIFEVPNAELPVMRELVERLMAQAIPLSVPVKVDLKTGTNWGEME